MGSLITFRVLVRKKNKIQLGPKIKAEFKIHIFNSIYMHERQLLKVIISSAHVRSKKLHLPLIKSKRVKLSLRYHIPYVTNKLNLTKIIPKNRSSMKKRTSNTYSFSGCGDLRKIDLALIYVRAGMASALFSSFFSF